ncbi:hypothetical protein CCP3SC1_360030 [Gammaproteobacteria bacterium]
MHPATLLRRVLVGITNKPEVIALYDRVERNYHMDVPCLGTRDARASRDAFPRGAWERCKQAKNLPLSC